MGGLKGNTLILIALIGVCILISLPHCDSQTESGIGDVFDFGVTEDPLGDITLEPPGDGDDAPPADAAGSAAARRTRRPGRTRRPRTPRPTRPPRTPRPTRTPRPSRPPRTPRPQRTPRPTRPPRTPRPQRTPRPTRPPRTPRPQRTPRPTRPPRTPRPQRTPRPTRPPRTPRPQRTPRPTLRPTPGSCPVDPPQYVNIMLDPRQDASPGVVINRTDTTNRHCSTQKLTATLTRYVLFDNQRRRCTATVKVAVCDGACRTYSVINLDNSIQRVKEGCRPRKVQAVEENVLLDCGQCSFFFYRYEGLQPTDCTCTTC